MMVWWWVVTLGAWLVVGALTLAFVWATRDGRLAAESRSWPQAPGVVLDASVASHHAYRSASTSVPQIRYQYVVDGQTFTGTRATFEGALSEGQCQALVDKYPRGAQIQAFYRPHEPSVSVLEPGGHQPYVLLTVMAVALLVIGAGALLLTYAGLQIARGSRGR